MSVTEIRFPVEEAMASMGMHATGSITHIDYDPTSTLSSSMRESMPTDLAEEWVEACINERKVNVDWLIAIFPHVPDFSGWSTN